MEKGCRGRGFSAAKPLSVVSIAGIIGAIATPIHIGKEILAALAATMTNLEAAQIGPSQPATGSERRKLPGGPPDNRTFFYSVSWGIICPVRYCGCKNPLFHLRIPVTTWTAGLVPRPQTDPKLAWQLPLPAYFTGDGTMHDFVNTLVQTGLERSHYREGF